MGANLEFDIHNYYHVRWSKSIPQARPDPTPWYNADAIDPRWDDVSYDWLNDFYSSHVSEVFYKIHGWVDDRIKDWQNANGITNLVWAACFIGPMDPIPGMTMP